MIIGGRSRGDGQELAGYLMRHGHAALVAIVGTVAQDLAGALAEIEAVAMSTMRSRRPFYHAHINPREGESLSRPQLGRAVQVLAEELGLTGQPFAVVEHQDGRRHWHVVWSRADVEHGRAISDSRNFKAHQKAAERIEQEFGHSPTPRQNARQRSRQARRQRQVRQPEVSECALMGLHSQTRPRRPGAIRRKGHAVAAALR